MLSNDAPRIKEAIIVEGKYDKATLSNAVDANIIEIGGFRIYKDKQLLDLIRRLANSCGVIVLTDSDRAGFQLRGFIKGSVSGNIKHAYIPDIFGKEKRKAHASAEGKLGVEGMSVTALRESILACADRSAVNESAPLTKVDFYELGLSGSTNSSELRRKLARNLNLPERLSADSLIAVINALNLTLEDVKLATSGN